MAYDYAMNRTFYQLGCTQAWGDLCKESGYKPLWLSGILDRLAGRNVAEALAAQHKQILRVPSVAAQVAQHPGSMSTFETYVDKALRGKRNYIPRPNLNDVAHQELVQALTAGRDAVHAERMATLKSWLGLTSATALPVAGGIAAASYQRNKTSALDEYRDPHRETAARAAAGVMGALPISQGLLSKAMALPAPVGKRIKDIPELLETLQPGDITLRGRPGAGGSKIPTVMVGGDPYGTHVETLVSKEGPTFVHSHPFVGGAVAHQRPLQEAEDLTIMRFRNPQHTQEFLKNLQELKQREDILGKLLGEEARKRMYDRPAAIRSGAESLLPPAVRGALPRWKIPGPGETICSSLPALCSPVSMAPGTPAWKVLPHDIQNSPVLEAIGHYRAPRTRAMRMFEGILRATPWLLRGALGLGLGYGAYKLISEKEKDHGPEVLQAGV